MATTDKRRTQKVLRQIGSIERCEFSRQRLVLCNGKEVQTPAILLSGISNSELRVYEQTGHSPTWELPERFARDLQQFIDGE